MIMESRILQYFKYIAGFYAEQLFLPHFFQSLIPSKYKPRHLYQGGRKLSGVWKLQQLRSRGMKSIGTPRPGYENLFNNSSKGTLGAKTAGQFFEGFETCQVKNEECSFQKMYNYAYILKYFC